MTSRNQLQRSSRSGGAPMFPIDIPPGDVGETMEKESYGLKPIGVAMQAIRTTLRASIYWNMITSFLLMLAPHTTTRPYAQQARSINQSLRLLRQGYATALGLFRGCFGGLDEEALKLAQIVAMKGDYNDMLDRMQEAITAGRYYMQQYNRHAEGNNAPIVGRLRDASGFPSIRHRLLPEYDEAGNDLDHRDMMQKYADAPVAEYVPGSDSEDGSETELEDDDDE